MLGNLYSGDLLLGLVVALVFFHELTELILRLLNLYSLEKWYRGIKTPDAQTHGRRYFYQKAVQTLGLQKSVCMGLFFVVFLVLRLPALIYEGIAGVLSSGASGAGYFVLVDLFFVAVLLAGRFLLDLPWGFYRRFVVEEHFGFNCMTPKDWLRDLAKGGLLALVLGGPVLLGLFWLIESFHWWWLWGFLALAVYQVLLLWLYPIFIAPLFNRFTSLGHVQLRQRLERLLEQCHFPVRELLVMDGSKRSKHSNAYFSGFGKSCRVVLYDTLIEDLEQEQLAAVLAHEVGHYKKKHIPKMILRSLLGLFLSFLGLYFLSLWGGEVGGQGVFVAFGFARGASPAVLFFVASVLSAPFGLIIQYLGNRSSRKHEFEADAYAAQAMGEVESLAKALQSLHRENLSNPSPHWLYAAFYYTHPSLEERLAAL